MPRLFLLFILIFSLSAHALDIVVDNDFQQQQIGSGVKYWLSNDSSSPPPALNSDQWQESEDTLTFGFDERTLWISFKLINNSMHNRELLLDIEYPLLDAIDITYTVDGSSPIFHVMGDTRPISNDAILHPHILAPLSLPVGKSADILMKIRTAATLNVPMTLWDSTKFVGASQLSIAYYILLYGILIGISLYHLVLFIQLREPGFLWFSLFLLTLVTIFAYFQGFLSTYVWPQYRDYSNHILIWFYALAVSFCSAYILRILNVRPHRPGYALSLYALIVIGVVLIFMSWFYPYNIMIRVLTLYAMLSVVVVVAVQIRRALDRYTPAYYANSAGMFCVAGMIVTLLEKTGFITSSFITRSAGDIGFAVMAILYALSLSYRMKWEQSQRKIAQQETLDVQADLLIAQTQLNKELEALVSERTSELEQANNKLKIISVTDPLTGLFNRRYFDEYFYSQYQQAYSTGKSIGLLVIDIDHFKNINDDYGHQFGDYCLIKVAKRIQAVIDHNLNVAARYGGEEFIVVLPGAKQDDTLKIADNIIKALNTHPISKQNITVTITASIGAVTEIPSDLANAEAMLKQADDYLYEAKRAGRNRTVSISTASSE